MNPVVFEQLHSSRFIFSNATSLPWPVLPDLVSPIAIVPFIETAVWVLTLNALYILQFYQTSSGYDEHSSFVSETASLSHKRAHAAPHSHPHIKSTSSP